MPPMGDARHPLGGKGTIPMTLKDNPQAPRSPYLRPLKPRASTHGGGTFDPRSPGLRNPHAVFWLTCVTCLTGWA